MVNSELDSLLRGIPCLIRRPNLSVVIPVHNEVGSLEKVVNEWDSAFRSIPDLNHVFIVCEDGSTDGTKELVVELQSRFPVINKSVPWRRGYSQAVLEGIAFAQTDYVLCIDGDGQVGPDKVGEAWQRRSENRFLIGWRHPRVDPTIRLVYSRMFRFYHRVLFPNRLHDPSCPFVLGHKELFEKAAPYLIYMREGFWWGFVAACCKLKISIDEIKIQHRERFNGDTQVYRIEKIPGIIFRNGIGLLRLLVA